MQDIRWIQRLSNYTKAFGQLKNAVELAKMRELTKLEQQGVIQCFEYTHELAWKTLKDFFENQGASDLFGSKDVMRHAFKMGLISNGGIWMEMIQSRNLTSHTYDEKTSEKIVAQVVHKYFGEFEILLTTLNKLKEPS